MNLDRKSLGIRFLIPILALILLITLGLVMLANKITNHIREDYQEFTVQAAASSVTTILEMAAADLTHAKLTGSPFVVEAKKKNVLEAIRLSWSRGNQDGIISAADGTVLVSTIGPGPTQAIQAHRVQGVFSLDFGGEHYLCIATFFPLWGWDVITIAEHPIAGHANEEVEWLLPGIAFALVLLSAGLYAIFRKFIQQPVAAMIANVSKGRDVAETGIAEFDQIGRAVNEAFGRERDRTEELENELGERMRAESLLKESEERVTQILNSIAEGIYGVDLQGNCTFCNPAALRLFGYERAEDLLGKEIHSLIHHTRPDGTPYPSAECTVYRCYHTSQGYHADDEVFWRSDGTSFPVEFWAQPVMREGIALGAVTVFTNITERNLAAESLRTSDRRFREVLENIALIGVMLDAEGRIDLCNDCLLSLTGWKREEVLHRNWFELFLPPDIRVEIEEEIFLKSIRAGAIPVHYENQIVTRAGERKLISWSNTVIRDKTGAVTGIASIGDDITQRHRMEEALIRSETLLQTIIDTEPDCVKMLDAEGNLIMMNRAGLEMLEADDIAQVKGRKVCPLVTSGYQQAFADLTARIFKGESGTLMFEMTGLKGRHLWLETRAVPFRNEKNEIIALLGITRDISDRLKLEEQLRQSQKMESIGTLAGGVAHDFNNILTAISGYGHMTLMKMAAGDPNRTNIQYILESADRAAHLTKDLLMFSRKQPIDRKPIDLNEGIQKLGKFLTRVIGEDIVFKTTLSGGTIPVLADAYQIDQVLMNLATNARDAMPHGGSFKITTEQIWMNEDVASSHGLGSAGKYAVISVSDTGLGMDEKTRERVFEPFFTTKEVGKGTGLGLSVVYGIVRQHDGQVTVYSEPGLGTTFKIYLPVSEAGTSADTTPREDAPVGGTEVVLLAEDDVTVREMTLLLLQDFGYTIITAVDGIDAIKKFIENKERVQLLLFDLIMPGKTGKEAYDEIRLMRPDIKVIFSSGYDPDMVRQKALLEQNVPVIYKPVPMAVLLKKIRSVLDEGRP